MRAAKAGDAGKVASLLHRAFAEYDGKLLPRPRALEETGETILQQLNVGGGGVAISRSRVMCGSVLYQPDPRGLYLGRLAVHPEWRGLGIATALIAFVEETARGQRLPAVTLNVRINLLENIEFFSGLGFRAVGRKPHEGGDRPTFLIMEKAVG